MFHSKKSFVVVTALTTVSLWLTGCLTASGTISTADKAASDTLAAASTPALGSSVSGIITGQFQYGDENNDSLQIANDNFEAALAKNPDNNQANLGAAIVGVLLAANSPSISNQLNNTVDLSSPLSLAQTSSSSGVSDMTVNPKMVTVMRKVAAQSTRPEFHQIQDTVANILLPAFKKAITRLTRVYNDPNFSMTLTIDGKARKIGHPEVSVLLAGFKALDAFATLLLSYDIDIDNNGSYAYLDTIGNADGIDHLSNSQILAFNTLTTLLKPGSPFLAVRSGWQTKLAGVVPEIKDALSVLKSGLASVPVGTGTNSNALLQVCATGGVHTEFCIESSDLDDAKNGVDTATRYMTPPTRVLVADTAIQINVAALFNVQDFKKMLPYYDFYDAKFWSDTNKPVLYFNKTLHGAETGNIKKVANILDNSNLTNAQKVAQLKVIIYWQDPTFQGFLPGATSEKVWALILRLANSDQGPLAKKSVTGSVMNPYLALDLLGQD